MIVLLLLVVVMMFKAVKTMIVGRRRVCYNKIVVRDIIAPDIVPGRVWLFNVAVHRSLVRVLKFDSL